MSPTNKESLTHTIHMELVKAADSHHPGVRPTGNLWLSQSAPCRLVSAVAQASLSTVPVSSSPWARTSCMTHCDRQGWREVEQRRSSCRDGGNADNAGAFICPCSRGQKNADNKKGRAVHALFTVTDTASAGATYPNRRQCQQHFATS